MVGSRQGEPSPFAALRQIQLRVCEEFRAASEQFASDPILSERVTDLSRSFAEGTRMLETRSEDWTSRRENFLAEYPSAKQSPEHLSAECRDLIAFRLYKAGLRMTRSRRSWTASLQKISAPPEGGSPLFSHT